MFAREFDVSILSEGHVAPQHGNVVIDNEKI
jgi:hypothetical protein